MSSPPSLPAPGQTGFAHGAAKNSCVCAFAIFALVALGSRSSARPILDLVALLLMLVGLISAVIALCGMPKHGTRGILAPALVGLAIHGLLAFIFVTNFVAARARAQEAAVTTGSAQAKP